MLFNEEFLRQVIDIAMRAGEAVMQVYGRDFDVEYKDDESPLTEADKLANEIILYGLKHLDSKFPILSEETKAENYETRKEWECFWLVDPIDGTKEFIKKNGEFTVNIALVSDGEPVLGVVYAPVLETMYYGMKGFGAFRKKSGDVEKLPIVENNPAESKVIRVVASRSHLNKETTDFIDAVAKQYPDCKIEKVSKGSSLKLCMVAEGSADIYPRVAPTMEWDTAAAQAVVQAAGKGVFRFGSFPVDSVRFDEKMLAVKLTYNKEDLFNPYFVVV